MRQYLSVAEFSLTPIGLVLAPQFLQTGVLDRALARASAAADRICKRHLGLNGATTLTAAASAGTSTIQVADCTGLDDDASGYVTLDAGLGTQETLRVQGMAVTWPTGNQSAGPPYPGTLTLASPLTFGHGQGAVVQGVTVEKARLRGGSTNPFDLGGAITQEAQLAEAHAPRTVVDELVRVVRLSGRPIGAIQTLQIVHRWSNVPISFSVSSLYVNEAEGWFRMQLGAFAPQGSDAIVTYTAGMGTLHEDMQDAVALLVADQLAMADPLAARGIVESSIAGRKTAIRLRGDTSGKSILRLHAETLLEPFVSRTF